MSDTTAAPVTEGDAPVVEETAPVVESTDPPVDDAPVIGDEPTDDEDEPTVEVPADLSASLSAIGASLTREQEAALAAELDRRVALRVEADTRIATFTAKGVIPLAARPQVEALLRHPDAAVRDGLAALLEVARPPVTLNAKVGTTDSEPASVDGAPTPAALAAMDLNEFTEAWAALTSAQRESPEYRAAYREQ